MTDTVKFGRDCYDRKTLESILGIAGRQRERHTERGVLMDKVIFSQVIRSSAEELVTVSLKTVNHDVNGLLTIDPMIEMELTHEMTGVSNKIITSLDFFYRLYESAYKLYDRAKVSKWRT